MALAARLDIDEYGTQACKDRECGGEVEELFCRGYWGEELAAEVCGIATGTGYGCVVSAGMRPGFAEGKARVADPDGRNQEQE